jgi:hypothetical protein
MSWLLKSSFLLALFPIEIFAKAETSIENSLDTMNCLTYWKMTAAKSLPHHLLVLPSFGESGMTPIKNSSV